MTKRGYFVCIFHRFSAAIFVCATLAVYGDDYSAVFTRELTAVNLYTISNICPGGKYITVLDACSDNAPVNLQERQTGSLQTNQLWALDEIDPERYRISSALDTNYCLRMVSGTSWQDGDPVRLYSWNNWYSQKWQIRSEDNRIRRDQSYYYITVTNETGLMTRSWLSGSDQLWRAVLNGSVSSPFIIRAPNGDLVAYFRSHETGEQLGYIFASTDNGTTWSVRKILGYAPYSPTFFNLDGNLYMVYCSSRVVRILKSPNSGNDWVCSCVIYTSPYVLESGGSGAFSIHDGYIYYGFMDTGSGGRWGEYFRLIVGSCPASETAVTNSANWTFTTPLAYPSSPPVGGMPYPGWLEPNCTVGPDGRMWVISRVENNTNGGYAAAMPVSADRTALEWVNRYPAGVNEAGFIDAPWAGRSKFHIEYDAVSSKWLAMSSPHLGDVASDPRYHNVRNTLALYESEDLRSFKMVKALISDDYYEDWGESAYHTGFQDPAFIIDGGTLRYLLRTAYRSLWCYHDANRGTYHELFDFRDYLSPDGEMVRYDFDDSLDPGHDSSKMGGSDADLAGSPVWSSGGISGGCLIFDGTDDALKLMHRVSPKLHGAKQVSLSVWIRNDENLGVIYSTPVNSYQSGLQLMVDYGKLKISGRSCAADSYQTATFNYYSTGVWHHVVATWDFENDTMRLWLDGTEQSKSEDVSFSSDVYARGTPAVQDVIGCHYNGDTWFKGAIDEFCIFNRELSAGEIANLYAGNPLLTEGFLFSLKGSR